MNLIIFLFRRSGNAVEPTGNNHDNAVNVEPVEGGSPGDHKNDGQFPMKPNPTATS